MPEPAEYARRYHELLVCDPRLGLDEQINITNYVSGGTTDHNNELWGLKEKLAAATKNKSLPRKCYFPANDVMDDTEPFFIPGINRVFIGKGSPEEIVDTLRLALRLKRMGPRTNFPNLKDYVRKFIGIDCNALVGNFYNLSPEIKPRGYAKGFDMSQLLKQSESWRQKNGFNEAVMLSAVFLPLKPRKDIKDVSDGDIVITVASNDNHEHIAMADDVRKATNGGSQLTFGIAEWGGAGGLATHIAVASAKTLTLDPKRYGLYFASGSSRRYIFAPPKGAAPAGWGRCGRDDV